jgi:hypothetical protein
LYSETKIKVSLFQDTHNNVKPWVLRLVSAGFKEFSSIFFDHPTIREISCTSAGKIFLFFALNLKVILNSYFETNVTFLLVTSLFWLEG